MSVSHSVHRQGTHDTLGLTVQGTPTPWLQPLPPPRTWDQPVPTGPRPIPPPSGHGTPLAPFHGH